MEDINPNIEEETTTISDLLPNQRIVVIPHRTLVNDQIKIPLYTHRKILSRRPTIDDPDLFSDITTTEPFGLVRSEFKRPADKVTSQEFADKHIIRKRAKLDHMTSHVEFFEKIGKKQRLSSGTEFFDMHSNTRDGRNLLDIAEKHPCQSRQDFWIKEAKEDFPVTKPFNDMKKEENPMINSTYKLDPAWQDTIGDYLFQDLFHTL